MKICFNMLGLFKQSIYDALKENQINRPSVKLNVIEKHYETYVNVSAEDEYVLDYQEVARFIREKFENEIYGINNRNVYTCAFELLKQNNHKIAIAESVSAGRLASEFVANNEGASNILIEGIACYTIESKINRLGLTSEHFEKYSPQSMQTSVELAKGLQNCNPNADFVIATTGYAYNDETNEDNGKCYIAIGGKDFIHEFEHKFNGTRNHIMQQVAKYAFLHLINEINNLNFDVPDDVNL